MYSTRDVSVFEVLMTDLAGL